MDGLSCADWYSPEYGIYVSCDLALFERMVSSDFVQVSSAPDFALESCKGEECIPQTWDMFHEKWGFMVIFWNFAGVPFVSLLNHFWSRNCSDTTITDLCLFGRLHGFSRPGKVQIFDPDLHRALHHVAHGVLRVGS